MTVIPDSPVRFVLFDMDGLLLDTEIIYTRVTRKIVGQYGKVFDWSVKGNMIGLPSLVAARYLVSTLNLPISAEDYLEQRDQFLREQFPDCQPLPGAEALIRCLYKNRIPIAVATSSNRELFEFKTRNHQNWFELFNIVVTGDDPEIREGKPSPDIFNVAARRLGADPAATLVFEDAPSGLAAGIAAGMRVIVVPDPNMDKGRYQGAEQILETLEDFEPTAFGINQCQQ
jgi:pseudouridine-5'-monophosphatase